MSGNPFRRKVPPQPQSILTSFRNEGSPDGRGDGSSDTVRRPSATKQVRIVTPPPLSPDDPLTPVSPDPIISKVADETHAGSPPPSPTSELQRRGDEAFQRTIVEDIASQSAEVLENTRRNSASDSVMPALPTAGVSQHAPINPFAKTLATMQPTMESQFEQKFPDLESSTGVSAGDSSKQSGEARMDVDSFTSMLMAGITPSKKATGAAAATSSTRSPALTAEVSADRSGSVSNTGRTAAAGQSDLANDIGDSSLDEYETDSDDPSRQQVPVPRSPGGKSKPPPPAHRHGRSVVSPSVERAPQTVSFDDFDISEPSVPVSNEAGRTSAPAEHSKPLPPAPRRGGPSVPDTAQVRNAPAPPLARRSSARQTPDATPRTQSPAIKPMSSSGPKVSQKPPPPPPSRRSGQTRISQGSDTASINSEVGVTESPFTQEAQTSRPPSLHKLSMVPPPPPRRRGSSKGSMDAPSPSTGYAPSSPLSTNVAANARKTSSERPRSSMESVTTASGLLATKLSEVEEEAKINPTRDILAEMSALQAEIDALRAKSGP